MSTHSGATSSPMLLSLEPAMRTTVDSPRHTPLESTRLVSAHLSIHARIQASLMRSGEVGSSRSTIVLDGVGILNTLSAQVVARDAAGVRAPVSGSTEVVLIEPARSLALRSVRIPFDQGGDPDIVLCWLDHDSAPIGEEVVMGHLRTGPLRRSFPVALPIEVRLWISARNTGDGVAAIELGGDVTLEKGILARLRVGKEGALPPGRSGSLFLAASPRARIASLPSRIVPIPEGMEPRISVRFIGDVGAPAGFEYVVGRYVHRA